MYENVKPENRPIARKVVRRVCRKLEIDPDDLRDSSRCGQLAQARRIISYLLEPEGLSWAEIGSIFGRERTAAISGADTLRARMKHNTNLRELVEQLAA